MILKIKIILSVFVLLFFLFTGQPLHAQNQAGIDWETPFASFSAKEFSIKIGKKIFYAKGRVQIHSDPDLENTTLEAKWQENEVDMKLFLYFRKTDNNSTWELYDIRSYNGKSQPDWIYYKSDQGDMVRGVIGLPNHYPKISFVPLDDIEDAEVSCTTCDMNAFMPIKSKPSASGYSLQPLIGLPVNEKITLTNDPEDLYSVNMVLKDARDNIVVDQSDLTYSWSVKNSEVAQLHQSYILHENNTCLFNINPPCPVNHAEIKGMEAGTTEITVQVINNTSRKVIAETGFPIKVVDSIQPTTTVSENSPHNTDIPSDRLKENPIIDQISSTISQIGGFFYSFFSKLFQS